MTPVSSSQTNPKQAGADRARAGQKPASPVEQGMTCPVCAAPYVAFVREIYAKRTERQIPLYVCIDCRSFFNLSGYRESDAVLQRAVNWHIEKVDRNYAGAERIFSQLAALGLRPRRMVDIGCGIGTLMRAAKARGCEAVGYEINGYAVDHGIQHHALDLRKEIWTPESKTGPVDLYLCIMVLEHLEQPRQLIGDLCRAAHDHGAWMVLSVPFVDRSRWPHLLDANARRRGTPFFDNDVHITHFSRDGMDTVLRQFDMQVVAWQIASPWPIVVARPADARDASRDCGGESSGTSCTTATKG